MKFHGLAFVLLVSTSQGVPSEERETSREITLAQAVAIALDRSPAVRGLSAQLEEAGAELTRAGTYPYNPVLRFEAGRRRSPQAASTDSRVAVSQEIEIRGQRGKRVEAARVSLEEARLRLERERRLLVAGVALAFGSAVEAREALRIEDRDASLARDFAEIMVRRLEAGAVSQIEANLPLASLGRAERRAQMTRAVYREAQSLLAEAVGVVDTSYLIPAGDLEAPRRELPPVAELVASASEKRSDLAAFRRRVRAMEARLRLARSEAFSNLAVGAFYEREERTDTIVGGALAVALPIFDRNEGGIASARAALGQARAESALKELQVRREVISAHARYLAAVASVEHLHESVLGSLEENLSLLERSFAAGKIGSSELLLFRRELVEARREYVSAVAEAWRAAIVLDLSAGRVPIPDGTRVD